MLLWRLMFSMLIMDILSRMWFEISIFGFADLYVVLVEVVDQDAVEADDVEFVLDVVVVPLVCNDVIVDLDADVVVVVVVVVVVDAVFLCLLLPYHRL